MLDDVLPLLRCPHCAQPLARRDAAVVCGAGHAFDVARQGYVNLLPPGTGTGTADTAAMVQARAGFLAAGHYDAVTAALAQAVLDVPRPGPVVDVGAGTGHHLARVLDRVPGAVGLAVDLSRPAARRAARAHPRIGAVVADAWQHLPVRDGVAGAVLSVFAPRGPAEAARVLAPGGRLVVVTPTERHLQELVAAFGLLSVDRHKDERLARQLAAYRQVSRVDVEQPLALAAADVQAVVAMGPSARHGLAAYGPATVTLSVTVAAYGLR